MKTTLKKNTFHFNYFLICHPLLYLKEFLFHRTLWKANKVEHLIIKLIAAWDENHQKNFYSNIWTSEESEINISIESEIEIDISKLMQQW